MGRKVSLENSESFLGHNEGRITRLVLYGPEVASIHMLRLPVQSGW